MDGDELRYDASVEDHGHFCCDTCGAIYDFAIAQKDATFELEGFTVSRKDLFVRGLCPDCAEEKDA
jgi:Fe2+ or Zn2+ uptake regulation protein